MSELIHVKIYNSRLEASLDKSFLQSRGIESFVEADDAGGSHPFPFQN